jgi:hypothetical protein
MSNFLKNNKTWMAASLLLVSSAFAQNCKPVCEPRCCEPHELLQCPTISGYSAPARIDIQCGWDVWADVSYIYWQALQENMEPVSNSTPLTTSIGANDQSRVGMAFKYQSGFKVGAGMSFDYDNWDVGFEYTWLHGKTSRSATESAAKQAAGFTFSPQWPNSINAPVAGGSGPFFSANWRLNLDFLDFELGRWYYSGTQFTARPSMGARVAWINQHRHSNILGTTTQWLSSESSKSWGIGPRLALDMNYKIGCGFRFFGSSEFDILFTRYHNSGDSKNITVATGAVALETGVKGQKINTLRPHTDLELGLGWGTYLCCHKWHVDISASYGYQVFWNQNMFRYSTGSQATTPRYITYLMPNGDLYVHGLTATVKLDF